LIDTGFYTITINSTMNMYGSIYKNNFTVFDTRTNLIVEDGFNNCNVKFEITTYLNENTTYILFVTILDETVKGNFSVLITGPNNVTFDLIGEYLYQSHEYFILYIKTTFLQSYIQHTHRHHL